MKAPEITNRQNNNLVPRKREAKKTELEIFRSPNSSPTRPIVLVPPTKRIKSNEDFEHQKTAPIIKPKNIGTKKIKTADKLAQPFAIKSSMETYAINGIFPKPNTFAQKRKIAQVEPFKVFDEDQPLDLSVKKKKVEHTEMTETTCSKQTKDDLIKRKYFFCLN